MTNDKKTTAMTVHSATRKQLPAAQAINMAHRRAIDSAKTAVACAIECGNLLLAQKAQLAHGEFGAWIKAHCEFPPSTAALYMRASKQHADGVPIMSLRSLYPSGEGRRRISNALEVASSKPRKNQRARSAGAITIMDTFGLIAATTGKSRRESLRAEIVEAAGLPEAAKHGALSARYSEAFREAAQRIAKQNGTGTMRLMERERAARKMREVFEASFRVITEALKPGSAAIEAMAAVKKACDAIDS